MVKVHVIAILFLLTFMFRPFSGDAQMRADLSSFDIEQQLSEEDLSFFLALNFIRDAASPEKKAIKERILLVLLKGAEELEKRRENTRLVAAILTLTLGPFGAHRLYLGTDAIVPVFYTVTLGGGLGILPVIDLFHILLSKDLSKYYNNSKVFMW
jgi:TM2 domain-containing membrane protein YozV